MPTKNVRTAYLKRMLKRLKGQDERIRDLSSAEHWSQEQLELVLKLLDRDRAALLEELNALSERQDMIRD